MKAIKYKFYGEDWTEICQYIKDEDRKELRAIIEDGDCEVPGFDNIRVISAMLWEFVDFNTLSAPSDKIRPQKGKEYLFDVVRAYLKAFVKVKTDDEGWRLAEAMLAMNDYNLAQYWEELAACMWK